LDQAQIARLVGFAPCSISREIRRHHVADVGYRAYWLPASQ
jgi:IS30 family transposase